MKKTNENWMKCICGRKAHYTKDLTFNGYEIDGWGCKDCGEAYFNPVKAEKILILNKIKKSKYRLKLGKVKSNLILRIPKEVGEVLNLSNGDEMELKLKEDNRIILNKAK